MGFIQASTQAFSFLEAAGFKVAAKEPCSLEYRSATSVVTVHWDTRSGELEVLFALQPASGKPFATFSLSDLVSMESEEVRAAPFQVAQEDTLMPFLEELADRTRRYAQRALAGDPMYFRRLDVHRRARAQASMRDVEVRTARAAAERAWQTRELGQVIRLLTSIEDQLTESERAKLAYAKRHQSR